MAANDPNSVASAQQRLEILHMHGMKDSIRTLKAMLDHLIAPGLQTLAGEILQCADETELSDLEEHYVRDLFKPSTFPPSLLDFLFDLF